MAPATTIGAAHPVEIGSGGTSESKSDDTMKAKIENYAISYIETIATRRKRNIEWARSSVKESASITSDKALELKVVEIIAKDTSNLLGQLNGREVDGRKLNTAGASIVEIGPSFSERVFQMIWRPEVMFILMLIAVYGIIGEMTTPVRALDRVPHVDCDRRARPQAPYASSFLLEHAVQLRSWSLAYIDHKSLVVAMQLR